MQSNTTLGQSIFPARIWVKTSDTPMCSNPNCCSSTSWVDKRKTRTKTAQTSAHMNSTTSTAAKRKVTKLAPPQEWRVLYQQREPDWSDLVRRKWMTNWLRGACSLHDALQGFEIEWGSCEAREWRAAA